MRCEKCGGTQSTLHKDKVNLRLSIVCPQCNHVQVIEADNEEDYEWNALKVYSPTFNKRSDDVSRNYVWEFVPGS